MSSKKQLANSDISAICSELGTIIQSGVSITDGLFVLYEEERDKTRRELVRSMLNTIEDGKNIYEAFKNTGVFPDYFLEMIAIGEKTGRLETVFFSLADYYSRMEDMSSSVKSAVVYPVILVVTIFVVISVLTVYVLPIFNDVFAQLGLSMTGGTGLAANIGSAVSGCLVYFIGAVMALILIAILLYCVVPPFKKAVKSLVGHTKTAKALYCARFANALSMSLSSGLDVDGSVEMSARLIDNPEMKEKISGCLKEMNNGKPFTEALANTGIFSPLHTRMINIGFNAGALDTTMKNIADKTERKVEDVLQTVVSRIEPTMVIIMAIAVGFILLSVMFPLLGVMTVLG